MIEIEIVLILLIMHFLADFMLQNDYVAINKSKSNKILLLHVFIYSIPFILFGIEFFLITMFLHFITDWCSSRITSILWEKDERHWFFVVIGLDQLIHVSTLILTYHFLNI